MIIFSCCSGEITDFGKPTALCKQTYPPSPPQPQLQNSKEIRESVKFATPKKHLVCGSGGKRAPERGTLAERACIDQE